MLSSQQPRSALPATCILLGLRQLRTQQMRWNLQQMCPALVGQCSACWEGHEQPA